MSLNNTVIGFIGSGQMMKAISGGMINSGVAKAENIIASDKQAAMLTSIQKSVGIRTSVDNREVVRMSDVVVLAIKPHCVAGVLRDIRDDVTENKLVVSIAAGITIKTIEELLPLGSRVIRVMPNTPALVQAGATFIAPGTALRSGDVDLVSTIFNSIGISEVCSEEMLVAGSGINGSGPAYIYAAIEAMADGGVKMGLPRSVAQRFAAQTFMGAAKMVLETGKHPGELKDMVCSPGGTTIVAMHKLEKGGFRGLLMDAVESATLKTIELGKT